MRESVSRVFWYVVAFIMSVMFNTGVVVGVLFALHFVSQVFTDLDFRIDRTSICGTK